MMNNEIMCKLTSVVGRANKRKWNHGSCADTCDECASVGALNVYIAVTGQTIEMLCSENSQVRAGKEDLQVRADV